MGRPGLRTDLLHVLFTGILQNAALIVAGTLVGGLLFGTLTLTEAFVLAVVLAPTDAALGQAVVTESSLPARIRQGLNIESGLNDGLAVPFFLVAVDLSLAELSGGVTAAVVRNMAEQIGWGLAAAVGAIAGQVRFDREWGALRRYAAERGVRRQADAGHRSPLLHGREHPGEHVAAEVVHGPAPHGFFQWARAEFHSGQQLYVAGTEARGADEFVDVDGPPSKRAHDALGLVLADIGQGLGWRFRRRRRARRARAAVPELARALPRCRGRR